RRQYALPAPGERGASASGADALTPGAPCQGRHERDRARARGPAELGAGAGRHAARGRLAGTRPMPRIDAFLKIGREQGGSDIHFTVGQPPLVRLDGELTPIKYRALTIQEADDMIGEILSDSQRLELDRSGSVDLSYTSEDGGRFRLNVCRH